MTPDEITDTVENAWLYMETDDERMEELIDYMELVAVEEKDGKVTAEMIVHGEVAELATDSNLATFAQLMVETAGFPIRFVFIQQPAVAPQGVTIH